MPRAIANRYHRANDVVVVRTEVANRRSHRSHPRVRTVNDGAVMVVRTIHAWMVVAWTRLVAAMVMVAVIAGAIAAVVTIVVAVVVTIISGAIAAVVTIVVTVVVAIIAIISRAIATVVIAVVVSAAVIVVAYALVARFESAAYAVSARLRSILVATVVAFGVNGSIVAVGFRPVTCFGAIGASFGAGDGRGAVVGAAA